MCMCHTRCMRLCMCMCHTRFMWLCMCICHIRCMWLCMCICHIRFICHFTQIAFHTHLYHTFTGKNVWKDRILHTRCVWRLHSHTSLPHIFLHIFIYNVSIHTIPTVTKCISNTPLHTFTTHLHLQFTYYYTDSYEMHFKHTFTHLYYTSSSTIHILHLHRQLQNAFQTHLSTNVLHNHIYSTHTIPTVTGLVWRIRSDDVTYVYDDVTYVYDDVTYYTDSNGLGLAHKEARRLLTDVVNLLHNLLHILYRQ